MKLAEALRLSKQHHNPAIDATLIPYAWLEEWLDPESEIRGRVAVYYWAGSWWAIRTPTFAHYGSKLMRVNQADAYFGMRDDWQPCIANNLMNITTDM